MLSLLYLVVRTLTRLVVGGRRGQDSGTKDLEILVLRHRSASSAEPRAHPATGPATGCSSQRPAA